MINSLLVTRYSLLNTIHKSILKELLLSFILSLVALNFTLMMEKVLKLSMMLSGVGASVGDMVRIISYLQPQLMPLTIPMSLLLSALLTYGRLNADNELVIFKTAGMSFSDISRPVFMLGSACLIAGLLVSFYAGPKSSLRMRELVSDIIMQRAPAAIEAGVFNASFKDIVVLVRDKTAPEEEMKGIFIYDNRNKKEPKVLYAKEGRISADKANNISMYMKDGYIHIARPGGSTEISFKGYNLTMSLALQSPSQKNNELTPMQLLRASKERDKDEKTQFLLDFHRRLSLPFLSLIVMFLAPPLSLLAGRAGRLGGLTIGLGVFTVFHIMLMYGENTARSGFVPHYIGAWAPVVLIGAVSVWVFRRAGLR
jgi:lipopolysaccharide export system permease protein